MPYYVFVVEIDRAKNKIKASAFNPIDKNLLTFYKSYK